MNVADRQRPAPGELFVDHVSHFVRDLDAAAAVFESLGMKVTPLSVQKTPEGPVGASNRCVMLEEGYIELLSPTHDTPPANRMRDLMRRYDGVHLMCYGTPDAEGEHRRLAAHGFEPQPLVDLSREVDGGTVRFKVVRLPPEKMPEGRIQYVQQLTPGEIWRASDVNRLRLEEVFVVAKDPAQAAARWARFAGLIPSAVRDGVQLETARGRIFIGKRAAVAKRLGAAPPAPAIAGYALACRHPEELAVRCRAAGIKVQRHGKRYSAMLPKALGGAWLFG
jgi:glyoxalase-like protein